MLSRNGCWGLTLDCQLSIFICPLRELCAVFLIAGEDLMNTATPKFVLVISMLLLIAPGTTSMGQTNVARDQQELASNAVTTRKDSTGNARLANVSEMARRVDSLQFIVVYNAELLRRDLDEKVVWIYVMLGVMIVASMMMYGALNQAQRQRKDLEERVYSQLAASSEQLEAHIKSVEEIVNSHFPPTRTASARKRKPT